MSNSTKYRILCLHGIGTNSEIFEAQTAALRYRLGDEYQFDFIEGAHLWPAAPGIESAFGPQICYSYHNGTPRSVSTALHDFAEYVSDNGPFHAVMGFSLGAALLATFLLHPMKGRELCRQIRSAIFICGTLPCDQDDLRGGRLRLLKAKDVVGKALIEVPTLHAWSNKDMEYPRQSKELVQMCQEKHRIEVVHTAGHAVPCQDDEVIAMEKAIREIMTVTLR